MDNLIVSVNVVIPLFLQMLLGYCLRHLKMVDSHTVKTMNKVTFRIFLPLMLFMNIMNCDLKQDFDTRTILMASCMSFVMVTISILVSLAIEKDKPKSAALAQGMFRNNYILFGIPIMTSVFGAGSTGYVSTLIACIIPLNNILAVILLLVMGGKGKSFKQLMTGIVTNPFVVSAALGFFVLLTGISFPTAINTTFKNISSIANPLSLILLGGMLEFKQVSEYKRDVIIGVLFKLVVFPLLSVVVFSLLGFRNERLFSLFIAAATPAAAGSPIMAAEMGADANLAGHLVVFGTALSVISIFLWILTMKSLGLI